MKNVTLSADDALIRQARRRASMEQRSLNDLFRQWIADYVAAGSAGVAYDTVMNGLGHVRSGGCFTREGMNERR